MCRRECLPMPLEGFGDSGEHCSSTVLFSTHNKWNSRSEMVRCMCAFVRRQGACVFAGSSPTPLLRVLCSSEHRSSARASKQAIHMIGENR